MTTTSEIDVDREQEERAYEETRNEVYGAARRLVLAYQAEQQARQTFGFAEQQFRNAMCKDKGGGDYFFAMPILWDGHIIDQSETGYVVRKVTSIEEPRK